MRSIHSVLTVLCLYGTGIALYSKLFLFTANHSPLVQTAKVFVAGAHALVFLLPAFLTQSRFLLLRIVGYVVLVAYLIYALFLASYFSYFGFVPEIYAFGFANAGDVSEVMGHYFRQVFGLAEIAIVILSAILFYSLRKGSLGWRSLLILIIPSTLFATSVYQFGPPGRSDKFGNVSVIRRFGIVPFISVSGKEWLEFDSRYVAGETPFPGKIAQVFDGPVQSGNREVTAPNDIDRVILIQIESFDIEAIDAQLNGKAVMPFVNGLTKTCLSYKNFFTPKSVGGSADSEFSVATGLVPSSKIPSISSADYERFPTLYDLLSQKGVDSYFAHNNNIGFYGRQSAYSGRIGNVTARFLAPSETIEEREFAEQALAHALDNSDRLFFYFFNFQSHGPYQGYSKETGEEFDLNLMTDIKSDYLATMHEVDQMIGALFGMQSSGFESGRNIFILTADHPSYLHTASEITSRARIPMLICHRDFEGAEIGKIASTVDLFPTILQVFGAEEGVDYIGQGMFEAASNVALIPGGDLLRQEADGTIVVEQCNRQCGPFLDYTNQHMKFSR